jgi:hypothetical protein
MKTNRIILIVAIASAIIMFGCTSLMGQSEPPKQYLCSDGYTVVSDLRTCPIIDEELEECKDMSSTSDYGASDRDSCFYYLALDRSNVSLCRKIRNTDSWYGYTSAECGAEIALYEGNVSLCKELSFLSEYDCYLEVATQTEDSSLCAQISSKSKMDECYSGLATALDDPTICGKMSSTSETDDCLYDYVSWNSYYITDWSLCQMFSVLWGGSQLQEEFGSLREAHRLIRQGRLLLYVCHHLSV